MPVGNVLVGDTRGDIEHDDTAIAVDVVTITQTTELLLSSGIPDVELELAKVRVEAEGAISNVSQIFSQSITPQWQAMRIHTGPRHQASQCTSSRIHQSSGA